MRSSEFLLAQFLLVTLDWCVYRDACIVRFVCSAFVLYLSRLRFCLAHFVPCLASFVVCLVRFGPCLSRFCVCLAHLVPFLARVVHCLARFCVCLASFVPCLTCFWVCLAGFVFILCALLIVYVVDFIARFVGRVACRCACFVFVLRTSVCLEALLVCLTCPCSCLARFCAYLARVVLCLTSLVPFLECFVHFLARFCIRLARCCGCVLQWSVLVLSAFVFVLRAFVFVLRAFVFVLRASVLVLRAWALVLRAPLLPFRLSRHRGRRGCSRIGSTRGCFTSTSSPSRTMRSQCGNTRNFSGLSVYCVSAVDRCELFGVRAVGSGSSRERGEQFRRWGVAGAAQCVSLPSVAGARTTRKPGGSRASGTPSTSGICTSLGVPTVASPWPRLRASLRSRLIETRLISLPPCFSPKSVSK